MATSVATRTERASSTETAPLTFGLTRTALLEALTRAATGLPKRSTTLPILNAVLIRGAAGELSLTCADLEQFVETRVPATVSGAGAVALPAKRLAEIISSLPSAATVEVTTKDNRAKLVAGRARFDVVGMPVDEFPKPELPKLEGGCSIGGAALVAFLGRVTSHIATSETRGSLPALAGALLEIKGQQLLVTGTDRHRLVRLTGEVEQGDRALVGRFVLPKTSFASLGKLFGADERITIEGTRQRAIIRGAHSTLTLALIGEEFPQFEQYLKFPSQGHCVLGRDEFADALRRVATVATEDRLGLTFMETELTIKAASTDAGRGEDVVACAFASDVLESPLTIDFNPSYVIDALDAIGGEQVRIDFNGGKNPIYIRDAKDAQSAAMTMVLPLQPLIERTQKEGK